MISVIIPVYNTQAYLRECIDSVIAQTYKDIEIILVDDGSKDDSPSICDEYAMRYSFISVYHLPNGGVTNARRTGLQYANGEWINFLDSDDTLPQDALENLYKGSTLIDTDFVVGFMHPQPHAAQKHTTMPLEKWREYCISGEFVMPGPVARLIKKSLFTPWVLDIPRDIVKGEDMLMNIRLSFLMTKDIVVTNSQVYNYRYNENSCVHTFLQDTAYEEKLHKLRLASIPLEFHERYLQASVHKRLASLNEIYIAHPLDYSWYDTQHYRTLMVDIQHSGYQIPKQMQLKFLGDVPYNRTQVWERVQREEKIYEIKCKIKVAIKRLLRMK